ncbi:hypothetical protein [Dictyobacter arantiisoli]|uniref:Uncharacterized protein n=1 Tax=Dictyobacter arantiisoli TaxID=2014874 RepID=A0A5A5T6Z8_9CHLR|nr:hypothetical protein [Dictyobacter arantiisoli]GCF06783.1 hypothetical protein KDI_03470 [Dictyobacter arantiisoli]
MSSIADLIVGEFTKKFLYPLLLIVCLAGIGAIPIASFLLPTVSITGQGNSASQPTVHYPEGQCTADPKDITYLKAANLPNTATQDTTTLPAEWNKANRTQQDLANAQACAGAFVENYNSFDYRNLQTLEAAIPMLSSAAKYRFYKGSSNVGASIRTDASWQTKIQQRKLIEVAQIQNRPALSNSEFDNNTLYITMVVPYKLVQQIDGQTTVQDSSETVLLKSIAPDSQNKGTGWQITDYRESQQ